MTQPKTQRVATEAYADTAAGGASAFAVQRVNHSGTQPSSTVSDFVEAAQDAAAALFRAGTNVTFTYDDTANTLTINATGGGGGTTDPEIVRDTIGGALVGGANIQITVNDAGDTITIAATGLAPVATSGSYNDLTDTPASSGGGGGNPAALLGFLPPVNGYLNVPGVINTGFNIQDSGTLYLHPIIVPAPMTVGAFRTKLNNVRTGGSGYLRKFGLYGETNGYPNLGALLTSTVVDDTVNAGGNGVDYPFTDLPLTAGRYWCASIMYYTSAPSDPANIITITAASFGLPGDNQNAPDAQVRSLRIQNLTDLPTTAVGIGTFVPDKSNNTPMLWLKRTA